ncbi:Oxygen-dependent coproporphyrinogen-III oxidase [Rhodotorula toruloides]|nr:Oxygen-dependent coproporphyrinogen-III oxidase [Rhodotorula toruloides]
MRPRDAVDAALRQPASAFVRRLCPARLCVLPLFAMLRNSSTAHGALRRASLSSAPTARLHSFPSSSASLPIIPPPRSSRAHSSFTSWNPHTTHSHRSRFLMTPLDPLDCEEQRPMSAQRGRPSFVPTPSVDLDDTSIPMRLRMIHHIKSLQSTICEALESLEPSGQKFKSSYYLRDASKGFGDSRVLQDGETFEKAGCNISVIKSTLSVPAVRQMRAERFDWWDGVSELPYFVAGCSLVVHPRNPHAPTIHFNYRYFEIQDPKDPNGEPKAWWFGGGTDLTPSYLYEDDARHFHGLYKEACDRHAAGYYARFKKWCDEYFYIPHRQESRGIGGIFFDDLSEGDPEAIFKFVRDCSNSYLPAYYPIVERRKDQPFTEEEKRWQQLRRGRYVEFNLVYDRGTKFGLAMKEPRTESILMSLPLTSRWEYEPEVGTIEGSREKKILDILKKPVEWA